MKKRRQQEISPISNISLREAMANAEERLKVAPKPIKKKKAKDTE